MTPTSNSLRALVAELTMARAMLQEKTAHVSVRAQEAHHSPSEAYLIAVAYEIHNFYGLCEQAFERIRSVFTVPIARPERDHEELLNQMVLDIPHVRPAVITTALRDQLDELRRFHHLFRHAYMLQLDRQRVLDLAERIVSASAAVSGALERFQTYLVELADRLDSAQ